jgi:hypothetical protein
MHRRENLPIDPDTGFPLVPGNYYFRVDRFSTILDVVGVGLYRVEEHTTLLRRRKVYKRVLIDWRWSSDDKVSPRESYVWLARGLWQDELDRLEAESLIGAYPPKKL